MSRAPVEIRRVTPDDVAEVLELWALSAAENARPARVVNSPSAAARLAEAIDSGALQVLLARVGQRPAGLLVLHESAPDVLTGSTALCVDEFYVVGAERRHGVGRAMLAHVAGHAERLGAEQIVAGVPPWAKDTHRYFAKLGFAPVLVRRATTPSALRRRLAGADGQRGTLENLLSRRRSLRARARRQRGSGGEGAVDDAPVTV